MLSDIGVVWCVPILEYFICKDHSLLVSFIIIPHKHKHFLKEINFLHDRVKMCEHDNIHDTMNNTDTSDSDTVIVVLILSSIFEPC